MELRFASAALEALYLEEVPKSGFSNDVVRQYIRRVNFIENATDQRDIRNWKSNKLEKLKGDRQGQHSIRLNDQFRLIIRFVSEDGHDVVHILEIIDYH